MRSFIVALLSALLSVAFTFGVMWQHYNSEMDGMRAKHRSEIANTQVQSFNQGRMACK